MKVQNEKDRLIELIMNARAPLISRPQAEKEADYLIEHGVIVPPCKIGDTVYEFFDVRGFYHISEWKVENIVIGTNPSKCTLYCKSKQRNSRETYHDNCFGETLFFTCEEAEKAMATRCTK